MNDEAVITRCCSCAIIMSSQGGIRNDVHRYILFPLIGFFMLFFPEDIFEIVNSQQNEANGEPTRSFLIGTRIGGAIMILLGIAGLVVTILGL